MGGNFADGVPATAGAESDASPVGDDLDGLTFAIEESFWHSGFAVTLESGTVEAQRDTFDEVTGHTLVLAGTFENLGDTPTWFAPEMAIAQGDMSFPFDQFGEVQEVPTGLVRSGNWQVFADWFALTTPDGASVPADGAELASLPGNDAGVTTEGLSLRFIVDEDASGDDTLQMVPADFWLDDAESEQDEVRATLDFSIE